jgi:hypothetical protein
MCSLYIFFKLSFVRNFCAKIHIIQIPAKRIESSELSLLFVRHTSHKRVHIHVSDIFRFYFLFIDNSFWTFQQLFTCRRFRRTCDDGLKFRE